MNIKRLLLVIITAICLYTVIFALGESLNEPQVQSRLELYQSNLILHASELKSDNLLSSSNNANLTKLSKSIIGINPYTSVKTQYQSALTDTQKAISTLEKKDLPDTTKAIEVTTPRANLKEEITKNQDLINELNLKLGILEIVENNNIDSALTRWQNLHNKTGNILSNLWSETPQLLDSDIKEIETNLNGWFRYKVLEKIYTFQDNQDQLISLKNQEQITAKKAIITLISIAIIPVLGGFTGLIILVFLLIQLIIKKEDSLILTNINLKWETPWNWEIIWQVLIVGFLFVSQILIPLLFGLLNFNPTDFSIRGKALYVFTTYLLMSGSGLLVLYLSIKSFFPLPDNWFKFRGNNWFFWGLGGYLSAIPLVFVVSFINQQFWQGQGGSNPLLFLALKSQDKLALAIFFITASIAAPIFEEIMFRGFLLPSLTRYLPVWSSILVSAFIFAIAHLSLAEVLPLATLGIVLGFVYTKSRSLLASILVHSLWNSGTLFSLFLLGNNLNT